jgi:hypothetical protein
MIMPFYATSAQALFRLETRKSDHNMIGLRNRRAARYSQSMGSCQLEKAFARIKRVFRRGSRRILT